MVFHVRKHLQNSISFQLKNFRRCFEFPLIEETRTSPHEPPLSEASNLEQIFTRRRVTERERELLQISRP